MISQQNFGSSDLPFPSTKAKAHHLNTTLPAVALFSSSLLSLLVALGYL
jgi:hypothetical protein